MDINKGNQERRKSVGHDSLWDKVGPLQWVTVPEAPSVFAVKESPLKSTRGQSPLSHSRKCRVKAVAGCVTAVYGTALFCVPSPGARSGCLCCDAKPWPRRCSAVTRCVVPRSSLPATPPSLLGAARPIVRAEPLCRGMCVGWGWDLNLLSERTVPVVLLSPGVSATEERKGATHTHFCKKLFGTVKERGSGGGGKHSRVLDFIKWRLANQVDSQSK